MLLSNKTSSHLKLSKRESEVCLRQYEKGDEITVSNSDIWQVYRGVVQLSRVKHDGREIIVGWVTANGTFGNYFDGESESYRAVALGTVYAKRYSTADVVRYPLLARQFLAQYSDRLLKSEQLLSIIGVRKVEHRLKLLLLMLKQEIGQAVGDDIRLQVRFTHQHLAEAICTTRVTITRILGNFQNRGLICIDSDRHIVFKDL